MRRTPVSDAPIHGDASQKELRQPLIPVSAAFGLPVPLPFLDVYIDTDNPLVLNPSAIRNSSHPRAVRARERLHSFFTEVLRCRDSSSRQNFGGDSDCSRIFTNPMKRVWG